MKIEVLIFLSPLFLCTDYWSGEPVRVEGFESCWQFDPQDFQHVWSDKPGGAEYQEKSNQVNSRTGSRWSNPGKTLHEQ